MAVQPQPSGGRNNKSAHGTPQRTEDSYIVHIEIAGSRKTSYAGTQRTMQHRPYKGRRLSLTESASGPLYNGISEALGLNKEL